MAAGDAVGEGVAGNAPGDVVGEGGVGGAGGVGAAGDGVVDGVLCDALVARVLSLDGSGRVPLPPLAEAWWFVGLRVVLTLVAFGAGGCRWRR